MQSSKSFYGGWTGVLFGEVDWIDGQFRIAILAIGACKESSAVISGFDRIHVSKTTSVEIEVEYVLKVLLIKFTRKSWRFDSGRVRAIPPYPSPNCIIKNDQHPSPLRFQTKACLRRNIRRSVVTGWPKPLAETTDSTIHGIV